ncbi:hypothetical protein ALQ20_200219 [Pseudomonas syringae pv. atrofaciens]|nr:hypothetical protein ALQ20_200219 [Pseudomonas syringae pv. atrofaciens]
MRQGEQPDRRETLLCLLSGAHDAVTTNHLITVAVLPEHLAVLDLGQRSSARADSLGRTILGIQRGSGHQQAQRPDRAAMRIHPAGGAQHRGFAFTAKPAQCLTQWLAHDTELRGGVGHPLESRPQRQRRRMHQPQVQVAVRAAATPVHQSRFGRQIGFVDQGVDGQIGQSYCQRGRLRCPLKCAHYQLLNLAGGL